MLGADAVVPVGVATAATTLVRDRIADVLADLQESLPGIRVITAHNRRRHNVVHHRNVVGDYRDANVYTARVGGDLRARHRGRRRRSARR